MKLFKKSILIAVLVSGCAAARDPALLKYEAYAAELDQRVVRGELASMEAENLKLEAYQEYQETRRREEKRLMDETVSRQLKSQNQEIQTLINQAQGIA